MKTAAIVGGGLIGQGWAIVFARYGWQVQLFDVDPAAGETAARLIRQQLRELEKHGLVTDADAIADRVQVAASLDAVLAGAVYVQENSPEKVDIKRALFERLDALSEVDAIIASSTSSIPASEFTGHLKGRARCLVAHPVNPPYLVPLVELCGAPWTSPDVVAQAKAIMLDVGQKPIVLNREIEGFVLNRLQGALLHEAFRLYSDGIANVEDIDSTIKDGLGLRWSFMGPFETIDLNAPNGIADYCARYGGLYRSIGASQAQCVVWEGKLVDDLAKERRARLPEGALEERRFWRDESLMKLVRHKHESGATND